MVLCNYYEDKLDMIKLKYMYTHFKFSQFILLNTEKEIGNSIANSIEMKIQIQLKND